MKATMIFIKKRLNNSINIFFLSQILLFGIILRFELHLLFGNPISQAKTAFLILNTLILIVDLIAWNVSVGPAFYKYWILAWKNFKYEGIYVNGYTIRFNKLWRTYQISHKNIGSCIAEFYNINEAIRYCKKG